MFAALYDDGLSDWKAMAIIVVVEFLLFVGLTDAAAVYLGHRLIGKGSPFIFLVGFAIALVNTPMIIGKHRRWDKLSTEFESYSTSVRIGGGIAVVLFVVAAVIVAGHFGAAQHLLPP
jgi:hypothetical protein